MDNSLKDFIAFVKEKGENKSYWMECSDEILNSTENLIGGYTWETVSDMEFADDNGFAQFDFDDCCLRVRECDLKALVDCSDDDVRINTAEWLYNFILSNLLVLRLKENHDDYDMETEQLQSLIQCNMTFLCIRAKENAA